ncbi:MAG: glycosyl transferase [Burkholderiales bacterium]|jgi:hypothetical protein|nr:glycosyl transferase [Burkholderiales bacterium]MCA3161485.1 glycosyl transferase [Burkholderiales bacterium]MCA3176394.1 glycosyl transferase [Burkholderiales bacterium]
MSEIHVFTSSAFNYIPKVRMLFQSLRRLHPEWVLHLALADELRPNIDLSQEPFDEVLSAADLNIPSFSGWAFCHTIVELATAIKPFMLAYLLKQPGCKKVIYFDPDTVAFSRLDDIVEALDGANVVLTPHQTKPEQSLAAVMDNEICSLKHGIYNLGFVAVAATEIGHKFADWWSKRVYHFCRADIPNGLFTDQRWIDLVPAFFSGVAIMRSSRHNVATWNLTTRQLSLSETGEYLVDSEPLGFYHFTGFDSGAHRIMAAKNAGKNLAVRHIVNWYANETASLAQDPLSQQPWAYGFYTDGTPISKAQRLVYRERTDLQAAFPDPFHATTYLLWWNTQGKVEFPDFFKDEARDLAMARLSSVLTPGYLGGSDGVDWGKLGGILRQSLSQPKSGLEIGKRGWEILKNEGVSGLKRRLLS